MKNKKFAAISFLSVGMLLTACQYTKDPNGSFKDEAIEYYKKYYADNPQLEKQDLFYFSFETTKGAIVRNNNENLNVEYLGMLNFSTFKFSENPSKYFIDIGNLPIKITKTGTSTDFNNFIVGDFYSKENGFDAKKFANNLPFVLHEKTENGIKTYSELTKNGVSASGLKEAYDPNFFFVTDFKIDMGTAGESMQDILNYDGKDLAILRKDIYSILNAFVDNSEFGKFKSILDFDKILKTAYKLSNNMSEDSTNDVPKDLIFPATHRSGLGDGDVRPVAIGPSGTLVKYVSSILRGDNEEVSVEPAVWQYENIYISEGITDVSFNAFEAERDDEGKSKSKNKNFYLPSTLQTALFNSFSNLDLDSIYIRRTKNAEGNFEPIELSSMDGVQFKIAGETYETKPAFHNTNFNKIYFEDFANENIANFPFYTTQLNTHEKIENAVEIYNVGEKGASLEKINSLNEALNKYDEVNPFLQLVLQSGEDKKYVFNCDTNKIAKGKKLYLPYLEFSLNDKDARMLSINSADARESIGEDAALTMRLESDLDVEGELIIGSQIGRTSLGSGAVTGKFAALDLNGHKLTFKNGSNSQIYGLIYDSSSDKTGEIIFENGSTCTANLTITDFTNLDDLISKAENGIKPFNSYKLSSLNSKTIFVSGSTLNGYFDYAGANGILEKEVSFIGNENSGAFIELTSGDIVMNDRTIKGSDDSNVTINNFDFLEVGTKIFNTANFGFSLANDNYDVEINRLVNKGYLIEESGCLKVDDLVLTADSKLISKNYSNVEISSSIEFVESELGNLISFNGGFKVNNPQSFERIYQNIVANSHLLDLNKTLKEVEGDEIVEKNYRINVINGENENSFTSLFVKFDYGFHYLYNSNYASAKLLNDEGICLAEYNEGDLNWKVHYNNGDSDVSEYSQVGIEEKVISNFVASSNLEYALVNAENELTSWQSVVSPVDGIYTINGVTYIKVDNTLLKGQVDNNAPAENHIFIVSSTREKYFRDDDERLKCSTYDDNFAIITTQNRYFAYVGDSYIEVSSYEPREHSIILGTLKYLYSMNLEGRMIFDPLLINESVDVTNKIVTDITSSNGKVTRGLTEAGYWIKPNEGKIGKGYMEFMERSYFYKNNKWLISLEGVNATRYVEDVDASFGVLQDSMNYDGVSYDFVYRSGRSLDDEYQLLKPEAKVTLDREHYSEIWEVADFSGKDRFSAYRYITLEGEKYLYYAEDSEDGGTVKPEMKKFEFAEMFTPVEPNATARNKAEKYAFIIMKVRFYEDDGTLGDVQTIYVRASGYGEDNAIIAGNTSDPNNEKYLALAIFGSNNPISDALK